ncbi:hypothetical protein BRC81_16275 [Halobacteriales archaeon QS_1_68_20]|nr:MAG: hypothetical protein BRC81_16275 [Halobacteriales archaeon QS_1_68_20]
MAWQLTGILRSLATITLRYLSVDPTIGRTLTETVRQLFVSGVSLTAPFLVTIVVLGAVLDFVADLVAPFADVLTLLGITGGPFAQGLIVALFLGFVLTVGLVAESGPTTGVQQRLGDAMEAVPGVGSMYSSVDRMSDVMLESDSQSFREVKLVEFPHADIYSLAFLTSEIDGGTEDGDRMQVLFVPLAPNPVMGGFMVCVPDHRVKDVDMSVDEAFQAIVTSGVAMTGSSQPTYS